MHHTDIYLKPSILDGQVGLDLVVPVDLDVIGWRDLRFITIGGYRSYIIIVNKTGRFRLYNVLFHFININVQHHTCIHIHIYNTTVLSFALLQNLRGGGSQVGSYF